MRPTTPLPNNVVLNSELEGEQVKSQPSPNFDNRPTGTAVDILVFHYTGMETAQAALDRLCDPAAEVSAHYLVDEDGACWQLVDESQRAWHAGVSYWRGETNINARSIGIEIVNPGHEFGYREFPDVQIDAVHKLALDILERHAIPARNVVGHSDVAPSRKKDPGEYFPWQQLADAGVGEWPQESDYLEKDTAVLIQILSEIGYDTSNIAAALKAFQRHYRPTRVTGRVDDGTARLINGLRELQG